MSSPFDDVQLPALEDGETALAVAEAAEGDAVHTNVGVCVTDQRILVFREEPEHLDKEQRAQVRDDIPLAAVRRVHESVGSVTEHVHIETAGDEYELPPLYVDTQHIVSTIVEEVGLADRERLEEAAEQETWHGRITALLPYLTASSGLLGIWLGVVILLIGIVISFSFFGLLVGIPFYFLGLALMVWGIEALIGEERENDDTLKREWVLPSRQNAAPGQRQRR